MLAADIDLAGRVVADKHHRKARRYLMLALDLCHLVRDAGAKLRCNDFSVDNTCRHLSPSSSVLRMISAQTRSAFVARENRLPLFRIMPCPPWRQPPFAAFRREFWDRRPQRPASDVRSFLTG